MESLDKRLMMASDVNLTALPPALECYLHSGSEPTALSAPAAFSVPAAAQSSNDSAEYASIDVRFSGATFADPNWKLPVQLQAEGEQALADGGNSPHSDTVPQRNPLSLPERTLLDADELVGSGTSSGTYWTYPEKVDSESVLGNG